jgi:hypothetical protein
MTPCQSAKAAPSATPWQRPALHACAKPCLQSTSANSAALKVDAATEIQTIFVSPTEPHRSFVGWRPCPRPSVWLAPWSCSVGLAFFNERKIP